MSLLRSVAYRCRCSPLFYHSQRFNEMKKTDKHLNPFWTLHRNDGLEKPVSDPSQMTKAELKKTLFFGSAEDPTFDKSELQANDSEDSKFADIWRDPSQPMETSDFFKPTKDNNPGRYTQSHSPVALFGTQTAEQLQRDKREQDEKRRQLRQQPQTVSLFAPSTQDAIDSSIQRIHGAYYRVTPNEVKHFQRHGYIVLPEIVSQSVGEEMPLIETTLMQVMSEVIKFEKRDYYDVDHTLSLSQQNSSSSSNSILSSASAAKQTITSIYHLADLLTRADDGVGAEFKSNYFDLRSLSIARQLLLNEIIKGGRNGMQSSSSSSSAARAASAASAGSDETDGEDSLAPKHTDFALKLIADACVLVDRHNFKTSMHSDGTDGLFEHRVFEPAQLAEVFSETHSLFRREKDENTILLGSVLGLQNAIMTLNLKEWDSNKDSPNVPLPLGSVLLFDVRRVSQVFWWRINNVPSGFVTNFYGFRNNSA